MKDEAKDSEFSQGSDDSSDESMISVNDFPDPRTLEEEQKEAILETIRHLRAGPNRFFSKNSVLKLFKQILTEINPVISVGRNTPDYFFEIFDRYFFRHIAHEYWKVKNDKTYKHYPQPLIGDIFMEEAYKNMDEFQLNAAFKI